MVSSDTERERLILERILSLKQMLKDEQGGPLELHELGICYYYLRNYEQARAYWDQLIDAYPDYVELGTIHALNIFCLIQEELWSDAEPLLHERLARYPTDTRLHAMLAYLLERTGRYTESMDRHRRVLEIDPDNLNSLNSLGYLLAMHGGPDDYTEAARCLTRAVREKPDHPAYLDSLGVLLARQGDRERAQKALYRALRGAPENQEIMDHIRSFLIKSEES